MTENQEDEGDPRINQRLKDVLSSIMCPIAGCWSLHGAKTVIYHDLEADAYVLECWPVGVEKPIDHEGNGHEDAPGELLYEFAEFDFYELVKEVPLERFHFSQREAVFEFGWKEFGHDLEVKVHIEPTEMEEEL